MKCPDCGGSLRVYRTYYPRHGNVLKRQYVECDACGGRRKIDSVDGGRIGTAQKATVHLNSHQNGHRNGYHRNGQDWAQVQAQLRRQMTQATYDTLIAPTYLISWRGGRVVIGTTARLTIDWLENRYRETIRKVLIEIDDTVSEIKFLEAE